MQKKVVIIGAGIAGISTAIRLQQSGYSVAVYEANAYPGGKLSEIKLGDYRFDAGPSLFTMPQFINELFELCGVPMSEYFSYSRKEVVCNYFYPDGKKFTAYGDQERFVNEASKVFNEPKAHIIKYLSNSKRKYDLTKNLFLHQSLHKLSTYLSKDTLKAIGSIRQFGLNNTLNQENKKFLKSPHLVQLFNRYATYNGSSPYLTPGIMSLIPHLEQYFGTFIPKGGMISITNALHALAERIGVKFHFNSDVTRISLSPKNKADGIWVKDQFIGSDIVVSNMDVVPTYRKLLADSPAPERTLKQERSSSALIFYWGINRSFPELDLHNIFFAQDYPAEFRSIFHDKTIGDDVTIYINITSKDLPDEAPKGHENWFVMVNAPGNTGQNWDEIIVRTRNNIVNKLSESLKVNLSDHIVCEAILDPRSIESRTQSYQGSLYGAASNNQFAAFLRHPNFSQKIGNLYFCGGSVHPGGGIPLCLLSGKITSDLIKRKYRA